MSLPADDSPQEKPHHHHPDHPKLSRENGGPGFRKTSTLQGHLVAASGEFVGTFFFLYFGFAGHLMVLDQASDSGPGSTMSSSTIVHLALIYSFSLLINAWVFFRISGGLFNPAVTVGMSLAGQLTWIRTLFLVPTQLLAALSAAGLVRVMFDGEERGRSMADLNTVLSANTTVAQGLFIECLMTASLVFSVLMLAAEKSRDTFLAPLGIGFALMVPMLAGVRPTGASLNPARSFSCAAAGGARFEEYHWIYWLGPLLGAALASAYYRFVKWANYEEANPGQDAANDVELQNSFSPRM